MPIIIAEAIPNLVSIITHQINPDEIIATARILPAEEPRFPNIVTIKTFPTLFLKKILNKLENSRKS